MRKDDKINTNQDLKDLFEIESGLQKNVEKGYMKIVGVDLEGNNLYKITKKGEQYVLSGFKEEEESI